MPYDLSKISMTALMRPAFDAIVALTRLDERIARLPVGAGLLERQNFTDACASLWIDGELVLHDATLDIRPPAHELTIARDVLRTRRRIAGQQPDFAAAMPAVIDGYGLQAKIDGGEVRSRRDVGLAWDAAGKQPAEIGLREHDRLALARQMMERKLLGRRTSSKLPELIELVMAKPLVSAGMIAKTLEVTPQAARRIVSELGLCDLTGRGRFRAWGVI